MRLASSVFAVIAVSFAAVAWGQSKNLAPGFTSLSKGATVVIMPTDIELFSISGGGVPEPKADWTEAASKYFKTALLAKRQSLGVSTVELADKDADELAEINLLHGAVARAIGMHHYGMLPLPTKEGKLDWSLGETVQPIKKLTGADYALFSWVRDSYASAERQAAMVGIAILTLGRAVPLGGMQVGYASLVDLNTGRVVWFNRLLRGRGDLREADKAAETLDALLSEFPIAK
jgi:hypothetical protein